MKWNKKSCAASLAVAAAVVISVAVSAQADLLLYEPFDYAVGTGLGGGQGGTATEPVGYTNAVSGTQWSAHQVGAGYNQVEDAVIANENLTYFSLATSGNSVNHGSGAAGAPSKYATAINLPTPIDRPADGSGTGSGTTSVYMSFLVRQNSAVHNNGAISNRFGFAEFSANTITPNGLALNLDAQSNSTVAMPGTVWMRPDITSVDQGTPEPTTHSQYGIGKSSGDGINASGSATWQNVAQSPPGNNEGSTRQGANKLPWQNQTYFIVAKYTFNDPIWNSRMDPFAPPGTRNSQDDSVSIYINPSPDDLGDNVGEASAAMTALYSATGGVGTLTADSNSIASFVLLGHRQGTGGANNNTSAAYTFDELRIGTTWADVTPVSAGLPGDFNQDGNVDAADYVMWRKDTSIGDYADFVENFGQSTSGSGVGAAVPEPNTLALCFAAVLALYSLVRR